MRTRQWTYLAPDRTDLGRHAAIQTSSLVEHATTHCIAGHLGKVTVNHASLLFELFLSELSLELVADGSGVVLTLVLVGATLLSQVIQTLVAEVANGLAQILVVLLVVILTLHGRAYFLSQLHLSLAHHLDGVMTSLEGTQQILLRHLAHFTFHHHDVVVGSTYHDIHVSFCKLFESRVNYILAIHACHTHLADRTVERNVGYS